MKTSVKFNVVYQNEDGSIEWVVGIGRVAIPKGATILERNFVEYVDIQTGEIDIEDYARVLKRNKYLSGVSYYIRKEISPQKYFDIMNTLVKLDPDGVMK